MSYGYGILKISLRPSFAGHSVMSNMIGATDMFTQRYGSKYGAKRTEYNGRHYDSKFEARVAQELELRKQAGEFISIEPQYRIKLYVYLPDGSKADLFTYVCDFRCEKPDGSYLLCEAKGYLTGTYRTKRKILDLVWLKDNPDYEFEEIRQGRRRG